MFAVAGKAYRQWAAVKTENGWRASCEWLIDRVGARVVNLGVSEVVWLDLDKVKLVGAPPEGFEYRFLSGHDFARYLGDENELSAVHVARAAAGHDLCFAALSGERLAAYGWYALGCIEAEHCDGVALSFPRDVAYMYKGFTHPDFRGQRLHGYIMRLALEGLARERGVNKLVSTVGWLNWPSLKSCDRLGYERLGRLTKVGWGPLSLASSPRAARTRGVRFGSSAELSARHAART